MRRALLFIAAVLFTVLVTGNVARAERSGGGSDSKKPRMQVQQTTGKEPKKTAPQLMRPGAKGSPFAATAVGVVIDPSNGTATAGLTADELKANPCASKPCAHDGMCIEQTTDASLNAITKAAAKTNGGGTTYFCECYAEWGGVNCEKQLKGKESVCVTPDYCQNGGVCVNSFDETAKPKQTSKCACRNGYIGARCEKKLDLTEDADDTSDDTPKQPTPDTDTKKSTNTTSEAAAPTTTSTTTTTSADGKPASEPKASPKPRSKVDANTTKPNDTANTSDNSASAASAAAAAPSAPAPATALASAGPSNTEPTCAEKPCKNGAQCKPESNGSRKYKCNCNKGWRGEDCDEEDPAEPCARQPCKNGGACSITKSTDTAPAVICACTDGWSGNFCETALKPIPKPKPTKSPAPNKPAKGATGDSGGATGAAGTTNTDGKKPEEKPAADTGATGSNAATGAGPGATDNNKPSEPDKTTGATGAAGATGATDATGATGATGTTGATDAADAVDAADAAATGATDATSPQEDPTACGSPCQHGKCLLTGTDDDGDPEYACKCDDGWKGKHCHTKEGKPTPKPKPKPTPKPTPAADDKNKDDTSNAADKSDDSKTPNKQSSDDDDKQKQKDGQASKKDPCAINPCKHGGVCVVDTSEPTNFKCNCTIDREGPICEKLITPPVPEVKPCEKDPPVCGEHGTCLDEGIGMHTCMCDMQWSGEKCDKRTNPCENSPCKNGGKCKDVHLAGREPTADELKSGFVCDCTDTGFEGSKCDTNSDDCIIDTASAGDPAAPKDPDEVAAGPARQCQPGACKDGLKSYTCDCPKGYQVVKGSGAATDSGSGDISTSSSSSSSSGGERCEMVDLCKMELAVPLEADGGFGTPAVTVLKYVPIAAGKEPCGEHGKCYAKINTFECACVDGYSGERCEKAPEQVTPPNQGKPRTPPTEREPVTPKPDKTDKNDKTNKTDQTDKKPSKPSKPPKPPAKPTTGKCSLQCENGGKCVVSTAAAAAAATDDTTSDERCDCGVGLNLGRLCNTAPAAPTDVTLSSNALFRQKLLVSFKAGTESTITVDHFIIEYSLDENFPASHTLSHFVKAHTPSTNSATDSDRAPYQEQLDKVIVGLQYFVRVKAANIAGVSAPVVAQPKSSSPHAGAGVSELTKGGVRIEVHFALGAKLLQAVSDDKEGTDQASADLITDKLKTLIVNALRTQDVQVVLPVVSNGGGGGGSASGGSSSTTSATSDTGSSDTGSSTTAAATATVAPARRFKLASAALFVSTSVPRFIFELTAETQDEADAMTPTTYKALLVFAEEIRQQFLHKDSKLRTSEELKEASKLEATEVLISLTTQCPGSTNYVQKCRGDDESTESGSLFSSALASVSNPVVMLAIGGVAVLAIGYMYCRGGSDGPSNNVGGGKMSSGGGNQFAPIGTEEPDDELSDASSSGKTKLNSPGSGSGGGSGSGSGGSGGLASQEFASVAVPATSPASPQLKESEDGSAIQFLERVLADQGVPKYGMKRHTTALRDNYISRIEQLRSLDANDWKRLGLDSSIELAVKARLSSTSPSAAGAAGSGGSGSGAPKTAAAAADDKKSRRVIKKSGTTKPTIKASRNDSGDGGGADDSPNPDIDGEGDGGVWDIEMGDLRGGNNNSGSGSNNSAMDASNTSIDASDDFTSIAVKPKSSAAPLLSPPNESAAASPAQPKPDSSFARAVEARKAKQDAIAAAAAGGAPPSAPKADLPKRKVIAKPKKPISAAASSAAAAASTAPVVATAIEPDLIQIDTAPAPKKDGGGGDGWSDIDFLSS